MKAKHGRSKTKTFAATVGRALRRAGLVARKTARYIEAGFNHIFVHAATPGVPHDVRRQWTQRFAREVMPRFAARVPHAGAVA